jgi:hypothetical protein
MPVRGRDRPVEIDNRMLRGTVSASGPLGVKPASYDLIGLAMRELQYRLAGVRELLDAVARQGALHVHHEHAATTLRASHSGT